jgi:hypothetical protein
VPTIPEPETVMLIVIVAAIFLWLLGGRKLARRRII